MNEMRVSGIALDPASQRPVLILEDLTRRRALPIWIGTSEASAISLAMDDNHGSLRSSYDLIVDLVLSIGYKVSRIDIHDSIDNIFLSSITLVPLTEEKLDESRELADFESSETQRSSLVLDARPSDAIGVALRANSPIFVSTLVFADSTVSLNKALDEQELDEFKLFLSRVRASDFELGSSGEL